MKDFNRLRAAQLVKNQHKRAISRPEKTPAGPTMADLRALSGMLEDQAQILRKAHKAVGKNPEWSRMAYHALEGAMASLARTQADVEEALNLLEKRAISD